MVLASYKLIEFLFLFHSVVVEEAESAVVGDTPMEDSIVDYTKIGDVVVEEEAEAKDDIDKTRKRGRKPSSQLDLGFEMTVKRGRWPIKKATTLDPETKVSADNSEKDTVPTLLSFLSGDSTCESLGRDLVGRAAPALRFGILAIVTMGNFCKDSEQALYL
jgi:hypothetical protein